ncbi:putative ribonuclease H-like domain-containing protein, partial [Tanacetum coccineum]
ILNGDSPLAKRTIDGVNQTYPPTAAEEKLARTNELKARGTLLMALPNEHQLKFNSYINDKSLIEAIKKRFGGNKESKKTQKTLPKKQYENFNGSSSEGLDQTYDRIQKLTSQLEILDLETLSIDDFTNEAVKTAHGVYAANFEENASTLPNIDSLSNAEIDLKWQMAMLTRRAKRFLKKTGKNLGINGTDTIGFDKTKVECYNCHRRGHCARECMAPKYQDNKNREITRRTMPVEENTSNALVSQCSSSSSSSNTEVSTSSKACLKSYETLKEHYDNLTKDFNKSQLNVGAYKVGLESIEARLDVYKKNEDVFEEDIKILKLEIMLRDNALIELRKKFEKAKIKRDDLKLTLEKFENSSKNLSKLLDSQVSDKFKTGIGYDSQVFDSQVFNNQLNDKYKSGEGYHAVPPPYTGNFMPSKPDLVLADKDEYVLSESVTSVPAIETYEVKSTKSKPKFRKPSNAKVEFVKSYEHVKSPRESVKKVKNNKQAKYPRKNSQSPRDCDFFEKKMVEKPEWNNASRGNPQQDSKDKGVIDSGCSRHMIGNRSFLIDYEEIDGGFVTFGGNSKGGKITGKGKIRTGNLDFEDVYFVKKLKFNLFSVSQMCDKKGKQHRTSCKTKTASSISQPLQMLHMVLFGPTFVKSLMEKMYCLVVTDDFSRFSWVFFLATKDETSEILKTFITGIENLIDLKVKVIRCDNRTKFKNSVMNQFYEMKGIKREFSVARTPQQNGIAKRKNTTLIEAARTMLADLRLPTPFWAEAVNTACRKPALSIIRPFGCLVTILNTIAHLGNQSNGSTGTKACNDAGKARMETVPGKDYILVPVWPADLLLSQSLKNSPDDGFKQFGKDEKRMLKIQGIRIVSPTVIAASIEDGGADKNIVYGCVDDPNMPNLEEIIYSDDDEDVGTKADMTNLDTHIPVIPIPTTRLHKDHPLEHIIRNIHSTPQTRRMTKSVTEHDLPDGKRAIGTKWVYRNKKDEKGIMIRNKARLVAQGYT